MKLYINGRFLTQQTTGVQQFAIEICKLLIALYPSQVVILVPNHAKLINHQFSEQIQCIGVFKGHLWEQISLPFFLLGKSKFTLINLCNTAPLAINGQIITLHDIAFKINPKWFSFWFRTYYNWLIPAIVKKSKYIITVSQTIKQELSKHYLISENSIYVLYNKVSQQLLTCHAKAVNHPLINKNNFYLMVGTNNPRKNFGMIESYFLANPSKKLVIVGGNHSAFKQQKNVEANNIIRLNYASVEELKWLYTNAIAFINPSLYEGFGIPNIEAMALGCLVVCNDLPVFREVCADVPYFFDTNDTNSFALNLSYLPTNEVDKQQKKMEGLTQYETIKQYNNEVLVVNLFG